MNSNITSDTCDNRALQSMQKWFIGGFIREILLANADISKLVNKENIYPLIAFENTKGNLITYRRQKYSKDRVNMGVYQDAVEIEILAVSDSYDEACEIAFLIDNTLSGKHQTEEYKFQATLTDSSEDYQDNKYIEVLVFEVK